MAGHDCIFWCLEGIVHLASLCDAQSGDGIISGVCF